MRIRTIAHILQAKGTLEGAGVHLHRGFGYYELPKFDPFLLFDDFSAVSPEEYLPGFPWHPHRGIETVTYVLDGEIAHADSIGHSGIISRGAVQWMTAGSGIIHQEMPQGYNGIQGFQLWVNLPKSKKMTEPTYQEFIESTIPEVSFGPHARVKVIAGHVTDASGPVKDIAAQPLFVDITLNANTSIDFPVVSGHTVFLYIFGGQLGVGERNSKPVAVRHVILLSSEGDTVRVSAGNSGARFLLVAGKPINEPIAWNGPIVMNTAQELELAFEQLQNGQFISSH